jgi:hypothetical protein
MLENEIIEEELFSDADVIPGMDDSDSDDDKTRKYKKKKLSSKISSSANKIKKENSKKIKLI